jgi:hypothetical protein
METVPQFHRRFLPLERAVLASIDRVLPRAAAQLMRQQVACVNKIQRLLEWQEVELYCVRWFRARWPEHVLFPNRGEFELGRVILGSASTQLGVSLFSVSGHIFSLESARSMRPFRNATNLVATDAKLLQDPMHVAEA